MGNWVVCPRRDSSKVALAVCIAKCEHKHECDEFSEVSMSDIENVSKKIGVSISGLEDIKKLQTAHTEHTETKNLPAKRARPTEVATPNESEALELLERALNLKTNVEARFLELGGVLDRIYSQKHYISLGYEDWKQFCAEALGIKWRWALYLRAIYLKKEELMLNDQDCAQVGITKLSKILPVMTDKRSAERWIAEAKKPGVTAERLESKVRQARGKITKEEAERVPHKLIYSLYEDQLETVERAHELAREITKSDSRAVQLEAIATEFRATYEHQSGDFDKIRIVTGMIRRLEDVMKVRIREVLDLETGEILRS